ncbi:MAG: hypothetical protein NTY36_01435 [Deltaproteobacteria bacterium]|nr:hypothetical protein [Deltaproteobacteria bacterium]
MSLLLATPKRSFISALVMATPAFCKVVMAVWKSRTCSGWMRKWGFMALPIF